MKKTKITIVLSLVAIVAISVAAIVDITTPDAVFINSENKELKTTHTNPMWTPPDQTFESQKIDTNLSSLDYGNATATDIFGPITIVNNAPPTFRLGDTLVIWKATDVNGNSGYGYQKITIVDTPSPS